MQMRQVQDGTHTVSATVGQVPGGYYFSIDYFEVIPNSETSAVPTSTAQNVTAIVAGGVGGIGGLIILATLIITYCLLSGKRSYGQSEQGLCNFHLLAGNTEYPF